MVKRCMHDSVGTSTKSSNTFLNFEITAQTRRGVVILPTIYVLIGAIYAGLVGGKSPNVCAGCDMFPVTPKEGIRRRSSRFTKTICLHTRHSLTGRALNGGILWCRGGLFW